MKTVAKTLLFDKNKKILVLYRGHTHPRYAHHPDFPGGEVEKGESSADAMSREISEETGLVIPPKLVNEIYVKEVNDQLTHIIGEARLEISEPIVNLSWEHEGFEWLTLEELLHKNRPMGADEYYLDMLEYVSSLVE